MRASRRSDQEVFMRGSAKVAVAAFDGWFREVEGEG